MVCGIVQGARVNPYTALSTVPSQLGLLITNSGRYEAAEATRQQLLERREIVLGKEHPHTLISMNEVAWALSEQGKYAEAGKMHRETLALR